MEEKPSVLIGNNGIVVVWWLSRIQLFCDPMDNICLKSHFG